jgi:hypothetical protein
MPATRTFNKVIEVAPPKTGTSSLGRAFTLLGLKHTSWNPDLHYQACNQKYDEILETAKEYEAFDDAPWHSSDVYKLMDSHFPGSKFILLERDIDSWVESYLNHFSARRNRQNIPRDLLIRGADARPEAVRMIYYKVHEDVTSYFKDRPDDLLTMNICAGDGWDVLCPFLGYEIPD